MGHSSPVPCSINSQKNTSSNTVQAAPITHNQMGKQKRQSRLLKKLLQKSLSEQKDFQLALLDFRNAPTNDTVGSPAQRLMRRRTKTLLPTTAKLLAPKTIQPATVKANLISQKNQQKFYHDLHSKPLSDLNKGDKVMFQCGKHWKPAVVDDICSEPRSYIITTPDGQVLRRNRKDLRVTQAVSDDEDSIDIDIETPIPGTQNIQDDQRKDVNQPLENRTLRRSTRTIRKPARYDPSNSQTA